MNWVLANLDLIASLTAAHLRQSAVPIAVGAALSLPLGWLAYRYRPTQSLLLTTAGLLYTIPSLVLFAILPPLLGLDRKSTRLNSSHVAISYAVFFSPKIGHES